MVDRSRRLRWERDMRALCQDLDDAAGTARHALQVCARVNVNAAAAASWGEAGLPHQRPVLEAAWVELQVLTE